MKQEDTNAKKEISSQEKAANDKTMGPALIIASILTGTIIMMFPDEYGSNTLTDVLRWAFIIFGGFGIVGELCSDKNKSSILGLDDVAIGIVLCIPSVVCMILEISWWINCFLLLPLWFGLCMAMRGVLKIIYSLQGNTRYEKKQIGQEMVALITKLLGVVLVVLQIVKVVFDLNG